MPQYTTRSDCLPRFDELAPVLDRLAELAERELHHPVMIEIQAWQDGDLDAYARHNYGQYLGTSLAGFEELRYEHEYGTFVLRYAERDVDTGDVEVLEQRVIGRRSAMV